MNPTIQWTAPVPLWPAMANPIDAAARSVFRQPAILRFASDTFMEEFLALLDVEPARMGELRAQPESWRHPAPTPAPVKALPTFARNLERQGLVAVRAAKSVTPPANGSGQAVSDPNQPLKLYHPAHQRFYLVSASLICQITGLPDKEVDSASEERVSFVVRRLRPGAKAGGWDEHAFTATPRGLVWQKVAPGAPPAAGEEQLPLFPVPFTAGAGQKRRMFAGMVPVGKREAYLGAPAVNVAAATEADKLPAPQASPREALLLTQVIEPWNNLIDVANRALRRIDAGWEASILSGEQNKARQEAPKLTTAARNQIQTTSWYVLLDFANYLEEHLREVWNVLKNLPPARPLTNKEQTLVSTLKNIQISSDFATALANANYGAADVVTALSEALVKIKDREVSEKDTVNSLERITDTYDRAATTLNAKWPKFLFPLADLDATMPDDQTLVPMMRMPQPPGTAVPLWADFNNKFAAWLAAITDAFKTTIADLKTKVVDALPDAASAPLPPVMLAAQLPIDAGDPGYFVIRCVFERPNCDPFQPAIVSDPAPVFQMATFFDPEAPARPIRISLPMDTTPAGLRKFDKNTAFMMSDVLCKQMDGLCNLSLGDLVLSVLPWPFHKDLSISSGGMGGCEDGAGLICSFSIPIITICALIILMMIVKLLDIVFNWMAFFRICFSLPNFLAKR